MTLLPRSGEVRFQWTSLHMSPYPYDDFLDGLSAWLAESSSFQVVETLLRACKRRSTRVGATEAVVDVIRGTPREVKG